MHAVLGAPMIAPRPSTPRRRPSAPARVGALAVLVGLVGLAGAAASGCGSSFPPPPLVPQTDDSFSEVPYPPPAAQIEFVPDAPGGSVAWVDGSWTWEGTQWRWTAGGWFSVPRGAAYAPWQTKRAPDGRLLFAPAVWRGPNGAPLEALEPVAKARSGRADSKRKDPAGKVDAGAAPAAPAPASPSAPAPAPAAAPAPAPDSESPTP